MNVFLFFLLWLWIVNGKTDDDQSEYKQITIPFFRKKFYVFNERQPCSHKVHIDDHADSAGH